jgi:hypothetical protein
MIYPFVNLPTLFTNLRIGRDPRGQSDGEHSHPLVAKGQFRSTLLPLDETTTKNANALEALRKKDCATISEERLANHF